jgi:hypothetical protein
MYCPVDCRARKECFTQSFVSYVSLSIKHEAGPGFIRFECPSSFVFLFFFSLSLLLPLLSWFPLSVRPTPPILPPPFFSPSSPVLPRTGTDAFIHSVNQRAPCLLAFSVNVDMVESFNNSVRIAFLLRPAVQSTRSLTQQMITMLD